MIAAAVARKDAARTAITCRSCSRPVDAAVADRVADALAKLGASPSTLAATSPICTRCARLAVELAIERAA